MEKKDTRTCEEKIKHLERSIKKFGDIDGSKKKLLKELKGADK
jgi:hypothetical protein